MRVKKVYRSSSLTVPSVRTETSTLKCDPPPPQSVKSKWAEECENSGSQCPASMSVEQLRVPWRGDAAERQHLRAAALGAIRCTVKEDSVPVPRYSRAEIICRPNRKKEAIVWCGVDAWWSSEEAENHRPVKASMTNSTGLGGKEGERHAKADQWLHCGLLVTSDIRSAPSVNTETSVKYLCPINTIVN